MLVVDYCSIAGFALVRLLMLNSSFIAAALLAALFLVNLVLVLRRVPSWVCIRSITAILSLELRRKQLLLLHASRSLIRGYDLALGMVRHQPLFLLLLFFF